MRFTVIENRILPPQGYSAINLGWIFTRDVALLRDNSDTLRHEAIHRLQMRECLFLPFFVLYGLEYVIKLCICRDADRAYRSVSFEQEAYGNSENLNYRRTRKHFFFVRYIFKIN
jgi:hypothetical protein